MTNDDLQPGTTLEAGGRVALEEGRELTNKMTGTMPTSGEMKLTGGSRVAVKDYQRGEEIFFVCRAVCRFAGIKDKPEKNDPTQVKESIRQHEFEILRFDIVDEATGLQLLWEARHPEDGYSVTIDAGRAEELRSLLDAEERGELTDAGSEPADGESDGEQELDPASNGHATPEEAEAAAIAARAAEIEAQHADVSAEREKGATKRKTAADRAREKAEAEQTQTDADLAEAAARADALAGAEGGEPDEGDDDAWE